MILSLTATWIDHNREVPPAWAAFSAENSGRGAFAESVGVTWRPEPDYTETA
jgi:hypothetical protein